MTYNINIIRSNRKTMSIEIRRAGELIVRSPKKLSEKEILEFVSQKEAWIQKHMEQAKEREADKSVNEPVSEWDIRVLSN